MNNKYQVISSTPDWGISGVNTFIGNLSRGLIARGIPARVILTDPYAPYAHPISLPKDLPFDTLSVSPTDTWEDKWKKMIDYLESNAPCIYLPNFDYRYSSVCPALSDDIRCVGIVHAHMDEHYNHARNMGRHWNAIVGVSELIKNETEHIDRDFAEKTKLIHYGVYPATKFSPKSNRTLNIIYAGRIVAPQKRVYDLWKIIEKLDGMGIPVKLTMIGDGSARYQFELLAKKLIKKGTIQVLGPKPNSEVLDYYKKNDVFILTSTFEGMSVSMLEAMGQGCIPVVTDVSGVSEIIKSGKNGYCLPVGDIDAFSQTLAKIQSNVQLRNKIAYQSWRTIVMGDYNVKKMTGNYIELFNTLFGPNAKTKYHRTRGPVKPPTWFTSQLTKNKILTFINPKKAAIRYLAERNYQSPVVWPSLGVELKDYFKYFHGNVLNAGSGNRDISGFIKGKVYNQDIASGLHNHNLQIVSSLEKIPVDNDFFDGVICNAVLEHVEKPDIVMGEISRVLKKGGYLYLCVPFLHPVHLDPTDYQRYTLDGLVKLAEKHGFQVKKAENVHNVYYTLGLVIDSWLKSKKGDPWYWLLRQILFPILRSKMKNSNDVVPSLAVANRVLAVKK